MRRRSNRTPCQYRLRSSRRRSLTERSSANRRTPLSPRPTEKSGGYDYNSKYNAQPPAFPKFLSRTSVSATFSRSYVSSPSSRDFSWIPRASSPTASSTKSPTDAAITGSASMTSVSPGLRRRRTARRRRCRWLGVTRTIRWHWASCSLPRHRRSSRLCALLSAKPIIMIGLAEGRRVKKSNDSNVLHAMT